MIKKGRDLTQSYNKSPIPIQYTCQTGKLKTLKRHQKVLLNIAIADRRRTVCWSNYSLPTAVVNRFTDPTGEKWSVSVCQSYVVTNMRDEMTRKLSVLCRSKKRNEMKRILSLCLSYLNPNMGSEMKIGRLSYVDPNIRGEMKFAFL